MAVFVENVIFLIDKRDAGSIPIGDNICLLRPPNLGHLLFILLFKKRKARLASLTCITTQNTIYRNDKYSRMKNHFKT